mgnify:CR=1 FL=1
MNGARIWINVGPFSFQPGEVAKVLLVIAFAGYLATRGNSVIIDHGMGVFTGYHHMSRIDVAQGQDVATGALVGAVGTTGLSTGPHLHWELVVGGVVGGAFDAVVCRMVGRTARKLFRPVADL